MSDNVSVTVRGQQIFHGEGNSDFEESSVLVINKEFHIVFAYHLSPGQYAKFEYGEKGCSVTVDD